jgi:hypothetical protein
VYGIVNGASIPTGFGFVMIKVEGAGAELPLCILPLE